MGKRCVGTCKFLVGTWTFLVGSCKFQRQFDTYRRQFYTKTVQNPQISGVLPVIGLKLEHFLLFAGSFDLGFLEIHVRQVIGMRGVLLAVEQAFDGQELDARELPTVHAFVEPGTGAAVIISLSYPVEMLELL